MTAGDDDTGIIYLQIEADFPFYQMLKRFWYRGAICKFANECGWHIHCLRILHGKSVQTTGKANVCCNLFPVDTYQAGFWTNGITTPQGIC